MLSKAEYKAELTGDTEWSEKRQIDVQVSPVSQVS